MVELLKKTGLPAECAGALCVTLWDDKAVSVENHSGVADVRSECVKFYSKKRVAAINGENLTVEELDGNLLRIKGKILSIEYLT